jgi:hypothetical protein
MAPGTLMGMNVYEAAWTDERIPSRILAVTSAYGVWHSMVNPPYLTDLYVATILPLHLKNVCYSCAM